MIGRLWNFEERGVIATGSYRRRRRRKPSKGSLLLALFLFSVLMVSCTAGNNASWFRSLLGTDLSGYRSEPVIAAHATEGQLAEELCLSVELLTSNSVSLREFKSTAKAASLYRDEILNSLMSENYSVYVGNSALSESVNRNYPHLVTSVMIPQSDFESAASRHLGLSTVSNRNGELFTYLSRSACYITPLQVKTNTVSISVLALEETEHTYRLGFSLTDTEGSSEAYTALFVKRDDGSAFIRALSRA